MSGEVAAPDCQICGRPSTRLCDYPIASAKVSEWLGGYRGPDGKNVVEQLARTEEWHTCDMPLCDGCTNEQWSTLVFHGHDAIDHCPLHRPDIGAKEDEAYREKLSRRRLDYREFTAEQADQLRAEIREATRKMLADRARVPLRLVASPVDLYAAALTETAPRRAGEYVAALRNTNQWALRMTIEAIAEQADDARARAGVDEDAAALGETLRTVVGMLEQFAE